MMCMLWYIIVKLLPVTSCVGSLIGLAEVSSLRLDDRIATPTVDHL